ncbi:hypothetical protein [Streptomyces sp. WMMC940]|uniref:hypothetical protein n=1 Tax=Streptomyces sp. WMMC940 TaxID=3015153 RepID=UPI0022B7109D|nr:hypothetical protein [Streptomyces sp. WMMC940]MCZ7456955.1 hypothetical protein [Streptomyces sp. WMMC940]
MDPEELGRLLGLRIASITMNRWFSADIDVVDQYAYQPFGCESQTLWLDGITTEQADTVEAAVVAAATALPVPTRAVIVDREGVSAPDDWDAPVLYDGEELPVLFPGLPLERVQPPLIVTAVRAASRRDRRACS